MKRIRNVNRYISNTLKTFRIASPEITEDYKSILGLNEIKEGMCFVPKIIGKITRINVEGEFILRKDLPKENRFIRYIEWKRYDWQKNEHTGIAPIYKKCYKRDFIKPYEHELIVHNNRFISHELQRENEKEIKHVINMFLEIFGEYEVITNDYEKIITKRYNFEILPPGEYPFEKIIETLTNEKRKNCMPKEILLERFNFYKKYDVKQHIIGVHGYKGYFGLVMNDKIIFDNNRYANAIYILNLKDMDFCKCTKKEILDNDNLCIDRIIHGKYWKKELYSKLLKYGIRPKNELNLF